MKKVIWMFPGQGAQYYQMGRELFNKEAVFRDCFEMGDELVRSKINESLIDIVFRDRPNRFDPFRRLLHTHPALFLFECAMAELLKSRGLSPDYLLGYSLGECAALVVSGAASLADVLTVVIKQAELTEYCASPGGMLAILESSAIIKQYPGEFRDCTVAGYNFERNFVLSGPNPALQRVQVFLKRQGVSATELPVDYAFHSSDMDVLQKPASSILGQLNLMKPKIPIISMEDRSFLEAISIQHLQTVIRNPIDFISGIQWLESFGPHLYVDLGPSGSMATAIKYNLAKTSGSEFAILSSPFGHETDNVRALIQKCNGVL